MGGGYVAKERKLIESVTELGIRNWTLDNLNFSFLIKLKCLKTSNYPNVLVLKLRKK